MASYTGAARILSSYLSQENGSETESTPDNFGADVFIDDFEDEFPMPDSADIEGWVPESRRANEQRPWGGKFGARPKIHEANQPLKAQERGWRLLDLHPNRDHKEEYYRLAGTPAELRIMLQIVRAVREMVGRNINFEEWFKLWEDGFPGFNENRNTTNFSLTGKNPWREKAENKPRFREWTTSQQRVDFGFRVIEYWRDRSEENSIILSGTDLQLIQHIIQIEYEGGEKQGSQKNSNWPPIKGQPQIKLYFRGENKAEGETSIRIMNKTDDPKIPLPLIDKNDLRQYANKIKQVFATPLYTWRKGQEIISYKSRWQGFEGQWWFCRDQTTGRELISKLLELTDQQLDPAKLRLSTALEEALAFPANPPEIVVLGEAVPQEKKRPLVDVKFWRAEIKLAKVRKPIPLIERAVILYQ